MSIVKIMKMQIRLDGGLSRISSRNIPESFRFLHPLILDSNGYFKSIIEMPENIDFPLLP
jgi:hypothetical protein